MGAGSIIKSLRSKYDCHAPVVGVEIDPVVIAIARDEFGVAVDESPEIHCMDAWDYIENSQKQFDPVTIDIFVEVQVPKKFYKPKFRQMPEKNIAKNGFVLFNKGIDMKENKVRKFVDKLPDSFAYQKNYNVLQSNVVIIMQKVF